MGEPQPQRVHFLVRGRVQGVGFRYFVSQAARERGVAGFVRNLRSGEVEGEAEALAEGALDAFLEQVRRGPPHARVDALESHPIAARATPAEGFHITATT